MTCGPRSELVRHRRFAALATLLGLVLSPAAAIANGLALPNSMDARAVGWSGAFVGIADDPSAAIFNPAGLALLDHDEALAGLQVVAQSRDYTPANPKIAPQSSNGAPLVLPELGVAARLPSDVSRWLVAGLYVGAPYGGAVSFPRIDPTTKYPDSVNGVENTQLADLEIVPSIGYQVNDLLSIGVGLRVGYGLFSSTVHNLPTDASLSMSGLGVGYVLGAMVRPLDGLQIGASYRSSLGIDYNGSASIAENPPPAPPIQADGSFHVDWPSFASLGGSYRPPALPALGLAAEADWTGWSSMQSLDIHLNGPPGVSNYLRFRDGYALHGGAEWSFGPRLAVRGGVTWDEGVIPDATLSRVFLDSNKWVVDLGASWQILRAFRLDAALDVLNPFGTAVVVPDDGINANPGSYTAKVYTFLLAGAYSF